MKKSSNNPKKNDISDLPPPRRSKSFHRPIPNVANLDSPDLTENPLNLYTLPYIEMIESIAGCFYPPNEVTATDRSKYLIKATDARIDRYILFRGAWEESFRTNLQLALRDLTETCQKVYGGKHFSNLSNSEQNNILEKLEKGDFNESEWVQKIRLQKDAFKVIYEAISAGLISDPGYGGNWHGVGWYYTNFMTIGV